MLQIAFIVPNVIVVDILSMKHGIVYQLFFGMLTIVLNAPVYWMNMAMNMLIVSAKTKIYLLMIEYGAT